MDLRERQLFRKYPSEAQFHVQPIMRQGFYDIRQPAEGYAVLLENPFFLITPSPAWR